MTLGARYFGIHLRILPDNLGRTWLWGLLWYPKGRQELGYRYFSMRWIG